MPIDQIPDMKSLVKWLGDRPRHPDQVYGLNESDCEILKLESNQFLVSTVDSISDEITTGLYRDPYTMGWVAAQSSLSDLAAVGCSPLGLLFSSQWGAQFTDEMKSEVARGFLDALRSAKTFLLGGDSGAAQSTVLTGVGLGMSSVQPVGRLGLKPGDILCVTGKTGSGPALAFGLLLGDGNKLYSESNFRPQARLEEGRVLNGLASAVMDTSDGLLSALNTLRSMNDVEFDLTWNEQTLDPKAVAYCKERNIPLWLLWLGEHGDFELVAGVPLAKWKEAQARVPGLQQIGVVNTLNYSKISVGELTRRIDFSLVTNLCSGHTADLKMLTELLNKWIEAGEHGWFQKS